MLPWSFRHVTLMFDEMTPSRTRSLLQPSHLGQCWPMIHPRDQHSSLNKFPRPHVRRATKIELAISRRHEKSEAKLTPCINILNNRGRKTVTQSDDAKSDRNTWEETTYIHALTLVNRLVCRCRRKKHINCPRLRNSGADFPARRPRKFVGQPLTWSMLEEIKRLGCIHWSAGLLGGCKFRKYAHFHRWRFH